VEGVRGEGGVPNLVIAATWLGLYPGALVVSIAASLGID